MNTIALQNFKAFLTHTSINFDQKNALIYGENGSGKSSLYEALKLLFYTPTIYSYKVDNRLTDPAEIRNAKDDILDSYNHQSNRTTRFTLSLNNITYNDSIPYTGYNACLINRENIDCVEEMNVSNFLRKAYIGISDSNAFIESQRHDLEDLINATINKDFAEPNIKVTFHYSNPDWLLNIEDTKRGLTRNRELTHYFNEGKLHIIILVLLFAAAQLNGSSESKKVLIIDDIFTSLDAANRTFFINYIHEYFNDWQKIILTHNVSLFNQIDYSFRKVWGESDKWKLFKIFAKENNSEIMAVDDNLSARKLRQTFQHGGGAPSLPNDIRKRFEYLVGEIASCMSIGGSFECAKILAEINQNKPLYYRFDNTRKQFLTIYDLIKEIENELASSMPTNPLKVSLDTLLSKYRSSTELGKLNKILQSLMVYQKVTMHSGSHATGTLPPLTQPEMDRTISLLQELENLMGNLFQRDMYTI